MVIPFVFAVMFTFIRMFLNFKAMIWEFCLICQAKEKSEPLSVHWIVFKMVLA